MHVESATNRLLPLVAICAFLAAPLQAAEVRVVATTSDVAAVFQRVGGDRVEVKTLAKGYMDPHYLQAKPSYVVSLRRADILAYNGLQLEIGWLPLILQGARNNRINLGQPGHVPMSAGLDILEIPVGEVSRAQGDVHPEGNPHYTLDPRNLIAMASTAEAALVRADPQGGSIYAGNRAAFVAQLQEQIPIWERKLAPYRGRQIVCYHKQWEYLLNWLGLVTIDYVENRPGIPPSPRHVDELERRMRELGIPVLLSSTFVDSAQLERLSEKTGAKLLVLPAAVGAEEQLDEPVPFFAHLVEELAAAFADRSSD
jgi:zinc/manganese transport system substrate-binding protein